MVQPTLAEPESLFLTDETAWLEATSELVRDGRWDEVDKASLAEYLNDMAIRDRREVANRLRVLLSHILKWHYQPEKRSRSWRVTIMDQRDELEGAVGRGVLRKHADDILEAVYQKAIKRAVTETDLPAETFPATCPWRIEDVLAGTGMDDEAK